MTNADLDVAIIGGGVSGLYTAWKLLTSPRKGVVEAWANERDDGQLKVKVFEASSRIGGRLFSGRSAHLPDVTCEFGGMRYIDTDHKLVTELVQRFGLETKKQVVYRDENIAFLRSTVLRLGQLGHTSRLLYQFGHDEDAVMAADRHKKKPGDLLLPALSKALPGLAQARRGGRDSLRRYLQDPQTKVENLELYYWGFWNLLLRNMSADGYQAAIDTLGYDVLGMNYNAVDMIAELFQFGDDVNYMMLPNGYEELPWKLRDEITKHITKHQGPKEGREAVKTGYRLDRFERNQNNNDEFDLYFVDGGLHPIINDRVTARSIVLAMPRRSLELLRPESPPLRDEMTKPATLNAVEPIQLYKLFLIYPKPWWEDDLKISEGRSVTDLPIRQCYYWPRPKNDSTAGGPAPIMIYNDAFNVDYWRGFYYGPSDYHLSPRALQKQSIDPRFAVPPPTFQQQAVSKLAPSARKPATEYDKQLRAQWDRRSEHTEVRLKDEMEREMLRMHGLPYANLQNPEYKATDVASIDWSVDPYGGAVHFWKPGVKSWDESDYMTQPISLQTHCYICGEAYSTNQTWVEGALETANLVLEKLGVTP